MRSPGRKEWEEAVREWKRVGRGLCCVIAAGDFVASLFESRVPKWTEVGYVYVCCLHLGFRRKI